MNIECGTTLLVGCHYVSHVVIHSFDCSISQPTRDVKPPACTASFQPTTYPLRAPTPPATGERRDLNSTQELKQLKLLRKKRRRRRRRMEWYVISPPAQSKLTTFVQHVLRHKGLIERSVIVYMLRTEVIVICNYPARVMSNLTYRGVKGELRQYLTLLWTVM